MNYAYVRVSTEKQTVENQKLTSFRVEVVHLNKTIMTVEYNHWDL